MSLRKLLSFLLYSTLICLALLLVLISSYLLKPLNIQGENYILNINKGDSLYKISATLTKDKVIKSTKFLRLFTYAIGIDNKLYIGEYEFLPNDRMYNLITKMALGDVKRYKIAIIEGETLAKFFAKAVDSKNIDVFTDVNLNYKDGKLSEFKLNDKINRKIISNLKEYISSDNKIDYVITTKDLDSLASIDGLLYPDTYSYTKGNPIQDIINRAFNQFNLKLKEAWDKRDIKDNKVIDTPYKAVILASIVEKESSETSERGLVAGVIYNRLTKHMLLQVDPTVIYALGESYKGNLSKEDLIIDSPYNTYKYRGLPPTPISFVSLDSLTAAINPVQHDLFYFVSMGNGKHHFSSTLESHNDAVLKYQKSKKKIPEKAQKNGKANAS